MPLIYGQVNATKAAYSIYYKKLAKPLTTELIPLRLLVIPVDVSLWVTSTT